MATSRQGSGDAPRIHHGAERSGLIVALGAQILRAACLEVVGWPEGVTVSVNVSVKQLISSGYVASVLDVLDDCACPPERLTIEITESCVADDSAIRALRQLRDRGIGLALDDFGTGYSSLSVLRTLPLSTIKIPREFVNDLGRAGFENTSALVSAILRLAKALHLDTIAEGVETDDQRSELDTMGCSAYQGFLESPPIPAHRVLPYLADK